MKNARKLAAAAIISIFAFSAVGCNMVSKTPSAVKKSPVAKFYKKTIGYEDTITKGELDEKMAGVLASFKEQYGDNFLTNSDYKSQYQDQEKQMLDSMITEKILLKKASELKLMPKDDAEKTDMTNKEIEELKKQYTEDVVKQSGFSGGYSDPKFKEYAANVAIMNKVYDNMVKDVKVDDTEIHDYFMNNQFSYTEKPNQIHVAHILVATEDEAKKVKDRLDKGEDFAKVAKEVSTDTGSKDQGGDLGTVPYVNSGMDQTFMNAAIALKEGEVSSPVNTQFGWHIIKTIKKETYPVKKFEDVKDEIKQTLLQQKQSSQYTTTMTKWRTDAKIQYYDKNM